MHDPQRVLANSCGDRKFRVELGRHGSGSAEGSPGHSLTIEAARYQPLEGRIHVGDGVAPVHAIAGRPRQDVIVRDIVVRRIERAAELDAIDLRCCARSVEVGDSVAKFIRTEVANEISEVVVHSPGVEGVCSSAANEDVGSRVTRDRIVASSPDQRVIAGSAIQRIGAVASRNDVGSCAACAREVGNAGICLLYPFYPANE